MSTTFIVFVTKCDGGHTYFRNVLITKEMFTGICTFIYLCQCTTEYIRILNAWRTVFVYAYILGLSSM